MRAPGPTAPSLHATTATAGSAKAHTPEVDTLIPACPLAVRGALCQLRGTIERWGHAPELVARVELVAAEICNNITEHGFRPHAPGKLRLRAVAEPPGLRLDITDNGTPPPAHVLAGPCLPALGTDCAALPEGGFGWFLIHSESDALAFVRKGGINHLSLRFIPRAAPHEG